MIRLDDKNAVAFEFARICSLAGVKIMDIYDTDFASRGKDDKSPVTDADELAEEIILAELKTSFPDVPVLAEESFAAGFRPEIGSAFILVDPVDGTKEFINKNGEFTVNIALIEDPHFLVAALRPGHEGIVQAIVAAGLFIGAKTGWHQAQRQN